LHYGDALCPTGWATRGHTPAAALLRTPASHAQRMGKKPAGKKKSKGGVDQRGYATVSVPSVKKEAESDTGVSAEDTAATAATRAGVAEPGDGEAATGDAAQRAADASDEEEWERALDEHMAEAGPVGSSAAEPHCAKEEEEEAEDVAEEEWERAVKNRLDEELQWVGTGKRFIPADATAQLERKGSSYTPAGVVVLGKLAEQKLTAALAPLRDEEGHLPMIFPRHWRFKGKLTYERINSIYLALEGLHFRGEQIRWAMMRTHGYDVRAAFEFLLVNMPTKEELPRQFGGEAAGETQAEEAALFAMDTAGGQAAPELPQPEEREVHTEEEPAASEPAANTAPLDGKKMPVAGQDTDFTKRWAAQYCAGHDSDSDELLDPEERLDRERRTDPTSRYLKVARQAEELTQLCKKLKEKKRQGCFKQNISGDMQKQKQATDRLRVAKAEMEDLKGGKYGKLDRARIDASSAPPARPGPPTAQAADTVLSAVATEPEGAVAKVATAGGDDEGEQAARAVNADDGDSGIELPSLFDGEDCAAGGGPTEAAQAPSSAEPSSPPCRAYNITGWGGRTPKQALEEFVRKRVLGKQSTAPQVVTYEHVPAPGSASCRRHWARAIVQQPRAQPPKRFDPEEPCETVKEAENLAAAYALLRLSDESDRPGLSRALPPVFKQRWVEWEQEDQRRLREAQRVLVKDRVEFVERLLRTKPPAAVPATGHATLVCWQQPGGCARGLAATVAAATVPSHGGGSLQPSSDGEFCSEWGDGSAEVASVGALRAEFGRRGELLKDDATFNDIQRTRLQLPVSEYRDQFLRLVQHSGVVVVSGATGSGKTTQVPQFLLQEAFEYGEADEPLPNIIVTEPRRISAVSVAKRVSQEMGDPPGGPGSRNSFVGYQIRLEKKVSESTRLLYCTVGVLLRRMQQDMALLTSVTHVFIDEVHERSADTDLLMLLLRQIRQSRPELRVIVMSATLEVEKLVRYFGHFGGTVPVLSVPGRTFPVETFWLEDAISLSGYRCEEDSEFAKRGHEWVRSKKFQVAGMGGKSETLVGFLDDDDDLWCDDDVEACDRSYGEGVAKTLARMDHTRINFDLIEAVLELIETEPRFNEVPRNEAAVLVFLPGLMEITKVHERLSRTEMFGNASRCLVLSLHSVLSGDDHAKAFERPRTGVRKIVLSTNIAETGVTIPDIVFVVDSGKAKSQRYHEASNTSQLKEQFISRAETKQRRGRAGRVQEGVCFHLVTQRRFEMRLQEMPTPEILRCSLMELLLSVLSSGLQPGCFLEALDPPPKSRIDQAVATLKATGAVEEGSRPPGSPQWGPAVDDNWFVVTPLGQCLARLPCDVRLGKMVLLAALFGGIEAVWTVAATLSHRSPLTTPFSDHKRAQARAVHVQELLPRNSAPSDHFALNTAYLRWDDARRNKISESFCRKHWLNDSSLRTIHDIRTQLQDSVRADGFCEHFPVAEVPTQELKSPHLAAALIFAGLYPNVSRVDAPKTATEKAPLVSAGSEQLKVHPGSLCHGRTEGLHRTSHRWVCYHEKVKTSQVFLRDGTFCAPNSLLLFGGDPASMTVHPGEMSVCIGGGSERHWQTFNVSSRTAAFIRQLRYAFDALLRRKASNPRVPLRPEDRAVIAAFIAVANSVEAEF